MKKLILLFSILFLTNCSDPGFVNDCFPNVNFNGTINLNLPEFNEIQAAGLHVITRLNGRDILIIRRTNTSFKAFDLECPEMDCNSSMTFEDQLNIVCPCSGKSYNSLNGSPNDGEGCFALEYTVTQTSSSTLQISR